MSRRRLGTPPRSSHAAAAAWAIVRRGTAPPPPGRVPPRGSAPAPPRFRPPARAPVAADARTVTPRRGRAWRGGAGGRRGGGCGGGGRGGGVAAGGTGGRQRRPQAPQTAGHRDRPHAPLRSLLVRPKMATISCPSLETRSSFQPRLRMSARQPMSFSHSWDVVRKTRRSATASQCGGYGLAVVGSGDGRAIRRVLYAR